MNNCLQFSLVDTDCLSSELFVVKSSLLVMIDCDSKPINFSHD